MASEKLTRFTITVVCVAILIVTTYMGVASAVFKWRHPTANDMAIYREFPHVLRFERLPRYQP